MSTAEGLTVSKKYVTSNYIGAYPLEKMLEYNWYLLHDKSEKDTQSSQDEQALLALLKNMSEDERNALMASL